MPNHITFLCLGFRLDCSARGQGGGVSSGGSLSQSGVRMLREGWMKHMIAAGFTVTVEDDPNLAARRESMNISADLASCHIGLADGYAFEGHIPVEDVVKFLTGRPAGAIAPRRARHANGIAGHGNGRQRRTL